jgi:hypothetical protein
VSESADSLVSFREERRVCETGAFALLRHAHYPTGSAPILILSPPRQGDQHDLGSPGLLPNAIGDFIAAQIGHASIEDGDITKTG